MHIPIDVHDDFIGNLFIEIFSSSGKQRRNWSKPIIIGKSSNEILWRKLSVQTICERILDITRNHLYLRALADSKWFELLQNNFVNMQKKHNLFYNMNLNFDDSYKHQVVFEKTPEKKFQIFSRKRIILLVDIWNQTLPGVERNRMNEILLYLLWKWLNALENAVWCI